MDNKLSELSKPVAWFTDDHLTDKSATTYSEEMAQRWRDKPWFVGNLYSQEYVSALLSQIKADREIKARLCRESNSLHDGLKAAEKRIAVMEGKLGTPVSSGYKLPADWRLDESTGAKILMYKDCSVIEDQQAEYVLSLIKAAAPEGGNG